MKAALLNITILPHKSIIIKVPVVFLVDISTDDMNFKAMKVYRKHQCVDKFLIKLVKTYKKLKFTNYHRYC